MLTNEQITDAIELWKRVFPNTDDGTNLSDYDISCILEKEKEFTSTSEYFDFYSTAIANEIDNTLQGRLNDYAPDQFDIREKMVTYMWQRVVRITHYIFNLDNANVYYFNPHIRDDINNVDFCEVELS